MSGLSISNAAQFDVGQLPSIPQVLLKLIEACHQVDVSFEELADIIQQDVGLSAKILSVANSPAYAQWNDVKDFNRLLVVLGLNTIKTIAITTAVHQFFSQFDPAGGQWMGGFWRKSLTCAHSARLLARLTGYHSMDEAYLAGLFHKVGQLVFMKQSPAGYLQGMREAHSLDAQERLERKMFGTNNTELGAHLVREWDPESFLSDAILYQQESAEAVLDTPRLVKLINFSFKLSSRVLNDAELYAEGDALFGLEQAVIEDLMTEVEVLVAKAADSLGIDLKGLDDPNSDYSLDSEEVRLRLARKVREFALLDGVRQQLGDTQGVQQALDAVLQDVNILFGATTGICFLQDAADGRIRAASGNCAALDRIREFSLAASPGRSLVADSLLQRATLSSLGQAEPAPSSVVDGQLTKLLGGEGIFCVPLHTEAENVGVLVLGVTTQEAAQLRRKSDLLRSFAGAAANTIQRLQLLLSNQQEAIEQEQDRQQGQVRKLVHEANNPLAIIKNYLQVLSVRLGKDDAAQEQLGILNEEIERVANIILRMRDVAVPSEIAQGAVDINTLLSDLVGVFKVSHFMTHGIGERLRLDDAMPPIVSNRNSLKQIITNLLKNAVEAMPEGGELILATRDRVNVNGRPFVELTIADNGPGIPGEIMENIFNPVRSTKGREHSGLGLTIVRNLVADLNGTISCRNRKSGGVEFVILLPRVVER